MDSLKNSLYLVQDGLDRYLFPVIIMIICFIIGAFILNKTYFGRYFYAVGGNIEAARLSGIRTGRVKYLVFALSGFFAGLAGIVLLSRTNSGMGNAGLGYEFKVITALSLEVCL